MNYNLHPIFVHFPIALLLLYSVLRIFPWPSKWQVVNWQIPRIILLGAGLLGAWMSNLTGDIASKLTKHDRGILQMHETFASMSVNVYVILLIIEIIIFIPKKYLDQEYFASIKIWFLRLQNFLAHRIIFQILALIGIVFISITGLLGGVMVHGVNADPLAVPVLQLLGL